MAYQPDELKPGEPLYVPDINPHMTLLRVSPNGTLPSLHRCQECNIVGTWNEVNIVPCTFEYPPCKWCGNTPICAWDCKGMREVFNNPNIYITGVDHDTAI